MSYFNYSTTLTDDVRKEYSGICFNIPKFSDYKNKYSTYIIRTNEEFRPDKISYSLYGDDSLSWVIDEINKTSDFSFYTNGKKIFYLPYDYLIDLGII